MIFCKMTKLWDVFVSREDDLYTVCVKGGNAFLYHDKLDILEKLVQLRIEGYKIPEYVFGLIKEEC